MFFGKFRPQNSQIIAVLRKLGEVYRAIKAIWIWGNINYTISVMTMPSLLLSSSWETGLLTELCNTGGYLVSFFLPDSIAYR